MAADVSSLLRAMSGFRDGRTVVSEPAGGNSMALITRDLLGGGGGGGGGIGFGSSNTNESQELDLDMEAPTGWEKRLDLKSGKVYLQRCNSSTSHSSFSDHQGNQTVTKLQDLNFPPSPSKVTLNLFDEGNLELKLVSSSSSSSSSSKYQSVCTLDKVKSALERVEKEPASIKKRLTLWKSSLSPSYSSSSSSMRDIQEEENDKEKFVASPMAAGCPSCLSYVLIMKSNPKCPRCNSIVPLPLSKKPRIDLNMSI